MDIGVVAAPFEQYAHLLLGVFLIRRETIIFRYLLARFILSSNQHAE